MPTIRNDLRKGDYRDAFDRYLEPGRYRYTLTASGGGKVAFKVREHTRQGEGKRIRKWKILIEPKSRISGGSELDGEFLVHEDKLFRDSEPAETTRTQFIFTRKAFSAGVDYEIDYDKIN
ncbi:hypothetical protein [Sphingorhabdus sp. Alg239-R122]|uniref:hypothetical protein n=1 Tax=Sphingorhabdus sp. Alg239-R122 TaxID=2305989 RepID=UPI0013DD6B19|nr:hypothetical protein [Sphingorhabdus sp. Alg239-R122]